MRPSRLRGIRHAVDDDNGRHRILVAVPLARLPAVDVLHSAM